MEYAAGVCDYDYVPKLNIIQNRAARGFLSVIRFTTTLAFEGIWDGCFYNIGDGVTL